MTQATPIADGAVDLDVDFAATPRADLVAALLAARTGAADDRPAGARIAALLRAYLQDHPGRTIELNARCGACAETFAFALPAEAVAAAPEPPPVIPVALGGDRAVTLRLPTGADLRRWHAAQPADRDDAVRMMLADLVVAGAATLEDEDAIAAAMEAHDPLVALTVAAACPACGDAQDVAIDLEGYLLAQYARRRDALIREVHILASHYGWSEATIAAIPASRRAAYIGLIEGAA